MARRTVGGNPAEISRWGDGFVVKPSRDTRSGSSPPWRHLKRGLAAAIALGAVLTVLLLFATVMAQTWLLKDISKPGVIPGEFENQEGMMICWPGHVTGTSPTLLKRAEQVLVNVVLHVHTRLRVICLIPNEDVKHDAMQQFRQAGIPDDAVFFIHADVDRPWVRDFGPLVIKKFTGSYGVIDLKYVGSSSRVSIDQIPTSVAQVLELDAQQGEITLDGGNLVSNGAGLAATTAGWNHENSTPDLAKRRELSVNLHELCGVESLVFLEPLKGEPTRHADMFVAFTAPDVAVVGEYSYASDPVNAAILERNAQKLASIQTPCGPLQVHRVPMPPPTRAGWYTYTNIVFANGLLLLPTYEDVDPQVDQQAMALYQKLLPGWDIVRIDATPLLGSGGSLHCATINLFSVGNLKRRQSHE